MNWRFWECGFGWLKKAQLIVFVKHSAGTWHVARAAIIINIIIIIFPPGNQHFSSFLQNSDRNKALGSQVPRSSWGPRSKSCSLPVGCALPSSPSTRGPASEPAHPADHTEAGPLLKRREPLEGSWVGGAGGKSQERVRVASRCSSGLPSHRQLTRAFTAWQPG